ncbi:hypothetical protein H9185_001163 [Listeria monocytogenes]|nr:hypothetical protein [Listeria monocytogenes]
MDKPLNTKYTYEFQDGTTAEMTLAFYALYMLRGKNKSLYERYNAAMNRMSDQKKGGYDELDTLTILYTAYLCANMEDLEHVMSEEEFLMKCGNDRVSVGRAMQSLTTAKKM